jgi:hypothetical protein
MDRPVYFYSDKCDFCRNLNSMLQQNPAIYGSMTLHNIDVNRNIPKGVKTVPTILFGDRIFSGNNAFAWVNEQIKHFNAQQGQQGQQGQRGPQGGQRGPQGPQGQRAYQEPQGQQQAQMDQRAQQMRNAQQVQSTQRGQQTHMTPQGVHQGAQQGPQVELEEYCDENGICGADLTLFNGQTFNGSENGSENVKSKIGSYMSINDYDTQVVKTPANQRR